MDGIFLMIKFTSCVWFLGCILCHFCYLHSTSPNPHQQKYFKNLLQSPTFYSLTQLEVVLFSLSSATLRTLTYASLRVQTCGSFTIRPHTELLGAVYTVGAK